MVTVKEKFHFKIRRDRFQRNAVRTVKYFIRLSCEHSEGPDTLRPCSSVWEHARGLYHRCLLSVLSVNIYRVEGIKED